jgi:coenzyme F420-0:L-glutamate ligase/coenzyme F420-1:gamma-L-glutamate ligase
VISIWPLEGIPEIEPGALLADAILAAGGAAGLTIENGDIFVVTHKIVSKAEGRTARILSDADYRTLIADEAADIIRRRGDLVITRTRHGFICANAAVDRSNTPEGTAVLLPVDPDRSAHRIRVGIERATGATIGVLISDTFGRAWRRGQTDVAIGMSGVRSILDLRGTTDHAGRELSATEVAVADELAGAADLVMGKAARIPVALVRGSGLLGEGRIADLVRDPQEDLFL